MPHNMQHGYPRDSRFPHAPNTLIVTIVTLLVTIVTLIVTIVTLLVTIVTLY